MTNFHVENFLSFHTNINSARAFSYEINFCTCVAAIDYENSFTTNISRFMVDGVNGWNSQTRLNFSLRPAILLHMMKY